MAGLSKLRQDDQIQQSEVFDDTLAAGATLESGAAHLEDDLNAIRSQILRILGQTNWYDDLASFTNVDGETVNRALAALNSDLDSIETARRLCPTELLTDITVGAGQNFQILSLAGSETPSPVIAFGATTRGAVTAQSALSGAGFGAHELTEIAGPNAIRPKNLLVIRDATIGQPIQSSGRDVFGLLTVESTATDGAAFDDVSAGNRAKISFVRLNAGLDDLEAVPVGDIAGRSFNYIYNTRERVKDLPEDCNVIPSFTDNSTAVDVTLTQAIANQIGAAPVGQDIDLQLGASFDWCFQDAAGADVFCINEDSAGGNTTVAIGADADVFDVDAILNDFANSLRIDTAGTRIDIGENPGVIETPGATDNLIVRAGLELFLDDLNQSGSSWAQAEGIKLSETTAEWDAFETAFGEVSLLNAITQAGLSGGNVVYSAACVSAVGSITPDTNVTGAGGSPNIDAQLADYSSVVGTFDADVAVFLNGQRQRGGLNAAANFDVYPGDAPASGDLKFERRLKNGDVIILEVRT